MSSRTASLRAPRVLTAVACAAAAVTFTPAMPSTHAQNVIPGDTNPGTTVVTALSGVSITVTQPTISTVTVAMTNSSGRNLNCRGMDTAKPIGGTVTEARVAQSSLAYYAAFPYKPEPSPVFGSTAANNTVGANIPLGPILGFLPTGSIAPALGAAYAARDAIASDHAAAAQAGHTGTIGEFTVNNNATVTRTVTLGPPAYGQRTDFQAAVFTVCSEPSGRAYAFAGYEGGVEPEVPGGGLLRSGSLG